MDIFDRNKFLRISQEYLEKSQPGLVPRDGVSLNSGKDDGAQPRLIKRDGVSLNLGKDDGAQPRLIKRDGVSLDLGKDDGAQPRLIKRDGVSLDLFNKGAQGGYMKVNGRDVNVFKIKNRSGYAAVCCDHLTEGSSPNQALERMEKALRRTDKKQK